MFGMGSKSIVGLDVGSSSIKAVELKKKGGQIEVAHLGLEPLASDIVVDSMIVDSGQVSSSISKLFADNEIKTKSVATAVSGHSVIVKKISMPSMSDQELAETIEKEAASHIPFDLADVSLDYQIMSEEAGNPQMDVLLVAVKKDKILNYTNVLSMAGRTPSIVDIDALALQNCYEYNYQPAPGQVVALLNLGASVMNINIVKGTTPLFPRDVSVGGHQYTDSLQKELDLSSSMTSDARGVAQAGQQSGNGQRRCQAADSATGDGNYRSGNSEDVRLFPGQCGRRAYRKDLSRGWIVEGAGSGGSVAARVLDAGGAVQSVPASSAADRRTWSGVGGAKSGSDGSSGGLGPEEL